MKKDSKTKSSTKLTDLGEFEVINQLTKDFINSNESTILGVGDDAAVIDFNDNQVLVSTDMMVEGVHFDLAYMPLKHLGYKALNLLTLYIL